MIEVYGFKWEKFKKQNQMFGRGSFLIHPANASSF